MEVMTNPVSQATAIRKILLGLPKRMLKKRMTLEAPKGFRPGLRRAAEIIGISTTTYARIEGGGQPDMATLLAILDWLEA